MTAERVELEGRRVTLLVRSDRLQRPGHLVPELVRHLRNRGIGVGILDPDIESVRLDDLRPDADLYVLVSSSDAALSLTGALEASGAHLLTSYAAAAGCRDKLVLTSVLCQAGVPVPASWMTLYPEVLTHELAGGLLVCKDPRGSRGQGVHVVWHADQLRELRPGTPWLVMRFHPPDGPDLKLYRIGPDVFGVARVFPARTLEEKVGEPMEVTADLRDLALRCSDAFGTTVCGVDVIRSGGRPWVVDMSSFPGFKGVPDAPARIAEVLVDRARTHRLERAT
jgi:ribosomal protein S6--L-glutamate ligase